MARKARLADLNRRQDGKYAHTVLGPELEFVEKAPEGEFVLRDDAGNVKVVVPFNSPGYVEVQCDRCGRFGGDVSLDDVGRWTCFAYDSDPSCRKATEEDKRVRA